MRLSQKCFPFNSKNGYKRALLAIAPGILAIHFLKITCSNSFVKLKKNLKKIEFAEKFYYNNKK